MDISRFVNKPSRYFPNPRAGDDDGVVGFDHAFTTSRLLDAYTHGVFPWPSPVCATMPDGSTLEQMITFWCSPDPRAILDWDNLHFSRRLHRLARQGRFTLTENLAFGDLMTLASRCHHETWITPEMIAAYTKLHHAGFARSVEVWCDGSLVGGIYGVAIRRFFAGESMCSLVPNASSLALHFLTERLRDEGYTLFDLQVLNDHTARFGGTNISRSDYLRRLSTAIAE